MRTPSRLFAALTAFFLSACASEPLFVEEIREFPATDGSLLVVPPVAGTDSQTGEKLAENMAWGLREAGYPAIFADQPDSGNPVLQGTIDETEFGQEIVWISLRWTLLEEPESPTATLRPIARTYRHQIATTIDEWAVLSRRTVSMIVAEAVPALNEFASSLIFPDGPPVRVAQPALQDEQFALVDLSGEAEPIYIGGDTIETPSDAAKPLRFAQFDPVFEPAAADPLPVPATPDEPEVTSVEPTQPAAPPPAPEAVIMPEPKGQVTDNSTDGLPSVSEILGPVPAMPEPSGQTQTTNAEEMPIVKPVEVERSETKATVAENLAEDDSPFSQIEETILSLSEGYVLTPEAAALVTTDPWLTIDEPVVVETAPGVESVASVAETQASETSAASEPPPPPTAPIEETLPQPVSEAVVAQTPASEVASASEGTPATEVAASDVSAGSLGATAAPNQGRPIFVIQTVQGAPGDGNLSLTTAIAEALRQMDAAVTVDPAQATHVVQGSVRVDTPFAGRQKVRIVWRVTTMNGEVAGQTTQENQMPQGSLDGEWGSTAGAVANAAVKGIERLFADPVAATAPGRLSQPDLPHVGND